jgi:hypothetical protein
MPAMNSEREKKRQESINGGEQTIYAEKRVIKVFVPGFSNCCLAEGALRMQRHSRACCELHVTEPGGLLCTSFGGLARVEVGSPEPA